MKLPVLNIKGKDTGRQVALDKSIFGLEAHSHSVYLAVKQFRANNRQGTSKSKERGEITGSTRKIKKQKGTGTARAGSIKNPLFRGGGRVFGPAPRDYNSKLNKKVKDLARFSALSDKANSKNLLILEDFDFKTPKTKKFIEVLKALKIDGQKSLLVFGINNNVYLSSRNFKGSDVVTSSEVSTYKILNAKQLVLSESSLNSINENLSK